MTIDTDTTPASRSRGGRPGRSGPPGNNNAAKHNLHTVKREIKLLTTLALDRRTDESKMVEVARSRLLADLGGKDNLSTQEQLLVAEASFLVLQLTAINTWLAKQSTLVDRRKRSIHPVVTQRLALVNTLRQLLADLGLKRRTKDVETLEAYLAARATGNGHASAPEGLVGCATEADSAPPAALATAEAEATEAAATETIPTESTAGLPAEEDEH